MLNIWWTEMSILEILASNVAKPEEVDKKEYTEYLVDKNKYVQHLVDGNKYP